MFTPDIIERLEELRDALPRCVHRETAELAIEEVTGQAQLLEIMRLHITSGHDGDRRLLADLTDEGLDLYRRYFGESPEALDDALDLLYDEDDDDERGEYAEEFTL